MSEFVKRFNQAKAFSKFTKGAHVMLPRSGTPYVIANVRDHASGVPIATIKRAIPKPKGKAARKAARKAKRESRGCL